MIDRRNRAVLSLLGLLLLIGGGLSAALGAGAFGTARSNRDVFDATLVGWWNEGGWESFAVVTAIGVVALFIGGWLALGQLHRNDGRHRTPTVTFASPGNARGETTLHSPAISHTAEKALEAIPDVHAAQVGLFGSYPSIELRAVLQVGDDVDLEGLPQRVDEILSRLNDTIGVRPDPVQIALQFKETERQRQVV